MITDSIGNYLTSIRNAILAEHKVVRVPSSNIKKEITKVLMDQGYILNYKLDNDGVHETIKIALKYNSITKRRCPFFTIKLISIVYFTIYFI